jgi:hypothetical protein
MMKKIILSLAFSFTLLSSANALAGNYYCNIKVSQKGTPIGVLKLEQAGLGTLVGDTLAVVPVSESSNLFGKTVRLSVVFGGTVQGGNDAADSSVNGEISLETSTVKRHSVDTVHTQIAKIDGKGDFTIDANGLGYELAGKCSEVQNCDSLEATPEMGTICQTSKGAEFERLADGWKDRNGISWYDAILKDTNYYPAGVFCGGSESIPTKGDFELAEAHGLPEIFKDLQSLRFWTSTVDLQADNSSCKNCSSSRNLISFYTYYLGAFDQSLRVENDLASVRCVKY